MAEGFRERPYFSGLIPRDEPLGLLGPSHSSIGDICYSWNILNMESEQKQDKQQIPSTLSVFMGFGCFAVFRHFPCSTNFVVFLVSKHFLYKKFLLFFSVSRHFLYLPGKSLEYRKFPETGK